MGQRIVLATLLALCSAPLAAAQGHETQCPDVKATQVGPELKEIGSPKTCGVGIVIFGLGGSIVGEKCFPLLATVPAHQECKGESNRGTYCVPDGTLEVKGKECHCGGLVLPIIQTGIPTTCVCGPDKNIGTVEDFETKECVYL